MDTPWHLVGDVADELMRAVVVGQALVGVEVVHVLRGELEALDVPFVLRPGVQRVPVQLGTPPAFRGDEQCRIPRVAVVGILGDAPHRRVGTAAGNRIGIVEIQPRILVVTARIHAVDREREARNDLTLDADARGPRFRRVRLRRAHRDAGRRSRRRASRIGIRIARIEDHRLDRADRGRDIELDVQEALIDVVAVAAAHSGLAVVERIPHEAEPGLEIVAVIRQVNDLAEAGFAIVAEAEIQRQVGPQPPLILREERVEVVRQIHGWIQRRDDVLGRIGGEIGGVERRIGREREVAVAVPREEAVGADDADVGAELEVVRPHRVTEVLDHLEPVLVAALGKILRLAEVAGRAVDLRHAVDAVTFRVGER